MNRNWYIFLFIWLVVILLGPITLLSNIPVGVIFKTPFFTVNFFQRLVGLTLFSLIFTQVVLGSMMSRWTEILTGKIFRFHITEGIVTYMLMFVHPILGSINGISLLPIFTRTELLYNLARVAFVLFTVAVFAGLLRTKSFLIRHWRKFHILNYVAFYLIAIHSYFVGSDTRTYPFIVFWWTAVVVVSGLVSYKLFKKIFSRKV